jgi:excisionase family DNA binding protein
MQGAEEAATPAHSAFAGDPEPEERADAQPEPTPGLALEPRRTNIELPEDIATAHPGMRQRLEAVLARQQQLPLDIDARRAFSAEAEDSPRETRDELIRRLLDPTLTLQEAAVLLDVCPTTVRRYTDRGVLRCFRTPGNQRRFHLSDVLDLMERQSRPLI